MQTPGSSFLHERNPNWHTSTEVEIVAGYLRAGGEAIPNEPADKISAYLGFLANGKYVNDGILTGDRRSIDRQIDAYAIKAEDVPEGYFKLQQRIAREQGHGDVTITAEMRNEAQRIINADQRHSLKPWAEYLSGSTDYPDWFKQYAFGSVVQMSKFDNEKGEFQKRSKLTTAPFPELNRGALSQVYTWLKGSKVDGVDILSVFDGKEREADFQKALKSGSFPRLYACAIFKVEEGIITSEQKKQTVGSWKMYAQNSDPKVLHGDLQGFGLDWCTATGLETAATHINGGDFYVYYTRDKDGKDTVPRIAVRMEQGEVAEVRGVNASQELEPEMAGITSERLKDLPGGEEYVRKAEDMKCLTAIEKKTLADPNAELTSDELRFLYELDHEIEGFGYERDPRIKEVRVMRGHKDRPELVRMMPEVIRGQISSAYTAYRTVADSLLGTEREAAASIQELEQLFAAKDKEWQTNGVYDYLVEKLITDGARFSLVATPNVEASEAQVVALAEAFGKNQPYPTYVNDELYRKGCYNGHEWSGSKGNAPVRLSLMPSSTDSEIGNRTVDDQVRLLRERQASRPELDIRVPSLLDAVTYWYCLRAQGDRLDDRSAFAKTYIRHFGLEPKTVGRRSIVPFSYVGSVGGPSLSDSFADVQDVARLAVG